MPSGLFYWSFEYVWPPVCRETVTTFSGKNEQFSSAIHIYSYLQSSWHLFCFDRYYFHGCKQNMFHGLSPGEGPRTPCQILVASDESLLTLAASHPLTPKSTCYTTSKVLPPRLWSTTEHTIDSSNLTFSCSDFRGQELTKPEIFLKPCRREYWMNLAYRYELNFAHRRT